MVSICNTNNMTTNHMIRLRLFVKILTSFGHEGYQRYDHLLQRNTSVLEGIAVVLCVVIELVRIGKEITAGTERIATADIRTR